MKSSSETVCSSATVASAVAEAQIGLTNLVVGV